MAVYFYYSKNIRNFKNVAIFKFLQIRRERLVKALVARKTLPHNHSLRTSWPNFSKKDENISRLGTNTKTMKNGTKFTITMDFFLNNFFQRK